MSGRRILTIEGPSLIDRIMASAALRYSSTVLAVALACVTARLINVHQADLLLLFLAVLLSSIIGGFAPGLIATALATWAGHSLLVLRDADLQMLTVEFVVLSLVGGTLRSARRKASERLIANMRLEQQILEIGDDERRRIGHDLHDGLGQHLTGIALLSETMSQQLQSGSAPDPTNVENITRLVSEAVGITRDLAKSLSPVTLERDGLLAAIEELADTSSTIFGIAVVWEFDDQQQLEIDRARALHLYRIIQEAVNNSVRHGKARHVRIEMSRSRSELIVTVTDDGSGLSSKTLTRPGIGLRIMQYRARMLDAALAVERATASGGTVVTCRCPIDGPALMSPLTKEPAARS